MLGTIRIPLYMFVSKSSDFMIGVLLHEVPMVMYVEIEHIVSVTRDLRICWAILRLCKYLLSLDHNRGDIGTRMNTNFWDLTFDRFLRNEYGSDCALGLLIKYSQNFVVPICI